MSTSPTSSTSSAGSSPISFNGLVSGLDTKSIIQALLQADQAPLNQLTQEQQGEQAKLQAYQDLNTKLQALQSTASTLALQSTTGAKQVSFSGPSGTFATATATADAANQSFSLQIDSTATSTDVASTASIAPAIQGTDVVVNNPNTGTPITAGTITINGQTVTISAGETFSAAITAIQTALQTGLGSGAPTATLGADNKIHLNSNGAGNILLGNAGDSSNFLAVTKLIGQPAGAAVNSTGPISVTNPTALLSATALGSATAILGTDVAAGNAKTALAITAGTFTVNGASVTVNAGDTFNTVFANINAATGGAVTASIVNNKIQLTSASPITLAAGSSNFLAATNLAGQAPANTITSSSVVGVAGSFNINGTNITYNTTKDALQDVLTRISSSAAGMTASYDPNFDKVTLTSTKTGNLDVTVQDQSGSLLGQLNVGTPAAHQLGTSAKYEVNGGAAQYSLTNTINNVVPNINMTLQTATPAGQPLTVTVSQNATVAEGAIQSFVTAYNAVVDTITKDTAYDTNTKTAGVFLGDPVINNLQQTLNDGLFIANGSSLGLTPPYETATSMGLSTGPIGSAPGTTTDVTFDTTQFEAAMQDNPTAVTKLATTVFNNLSQSLIQITQPGGLIDSSIQSENTQIQDFQTQIDTQKAFIADQQTFLTQEYAQLEAQLAQLQSQAAVGASALASFNTASINQSAATNSTSSLLGGSTGSSSGA